MRNYLAILNREMKSYFNSPIAYAMIGLFLFISGIFFYLIISSFVQYNNQMMMQAAQYRMAPPSVNVNMMAIRPIFHNMALFAVLFLPLITMRLYAEEKRSGTIELLLTSPISNFQCILGKFSAAALLFLGMLALTFIYMMLIYIYGNPETGPILTGYLGLFLLGASYLAFGVFFSSLTVNQIIAGVSTIAFILVFWAIGWVSEFFSPGIGKLLANFSLIEHFEDFSKGVFDTKHLVFYLSFIFMGLFLTFISIESTRWKGNR